nr:pentatricopeptide repeat-containing protein At5g15010, mitochondrial isoform X1 [Ipomoea batatas]
MARNVQKSQTLAIHLIRKLHTVKYGSPLLLHNRRDTVEELLDRHIFKEKKSLNNDDNEILSHQRTHCEALSLCRDIIRATRFFMWRDNSKPSPILRLGFPTFGSISSSYTSSSNEQLDNPSLDSKNGDTRYEYCSDSDEDNGNPVVHGSQVYPNESLETIMGILRVPGASASQVNRQLEQCHVKILPELVSAVLSSVRNDWELAFTFFLWAGKQSGYAHSVREYHSMIAILGKMRKFDTAWALIDEMRGGRNGPSFVSPNTLLIMIRKYCAAHDVGKAISTFHAHRRFNFEIGMEEFQKLLSALCRYKNVKAAESLMFSNKKVFPLNTKSFNVILNGWCNVVGELREGKRIWRLMKEMGVPRDVYSYSSIMSSYSKSTNLNAVLRLFDQMKEYGIAPDRKVYNAVIHALAKERLMKEAQNVMKTMEEKGISPDVVTYNSIIMPICKRRLLNEAKGIFNEMTKRGITPTVRTYHAFFRILRTEEEVFELLHNMNVMGCHPTHETYIMLIRKFCRWQQLDLVFKLWADMIQNGLDPDRSSYIVLIHGLFLNGKLEDAHKYYLEMKEKDLLPEPKIEEMLQAWIAGKQAAGPMMTNSIENIGIFSSPEKK